MKILLSSIEDIRDQVIELDKCIKFVGFAIKAGKIIAYKYRKEAVVDIGRNMTFFYRLCINDGIRRDGMWSHCSSDIMCASLINQ